MTITDFLTKVREIASERPAYRLGRDGSDGLCDCIGLIIGAIRRNGIEYTETHGSNWFARHYTSSLMRVTDADDLSLGDIVYKARTPGAAKYDLPSRYAKDPDKYDYYHVGVVTGVNPLEITHCTSSGSVDGITKDVKLGGWTHKGQLTLIDQITEEDAPMAGTTGIVTAANGKPVNMRKGPKTTAQLVDRVPVGAQVTVNSYDDSWAQIAYRGATGYMMTKYLEISAAAPEAVSGALEQRVAELTAAVADLQKRVTALEGGVSVG